MAAVEMLPMPAMAEGDGDDGPAYLVGGGGGGSGSTDVAEQFFRRLKHHWNQGCNSIDIIFVPESGPKCGPSHVLSFETCLNLECPSNEVVAELGPVFFAPKIQNVY